MNRIYKGLIILLVFVFAGCSDKPAGRLIDEQIKLIDNNVKQICGSDYEAVNFKVLEETYSGTEKNTYRIKFTFDLNKPFLAISSGIPGEMVFEKRKAGWECTFNSGNALGLFNLTK